MIGSKLGDFATENHLKNTGDLIYGSFDGYEVSFFEDDAGKSFFIDMYLPEDRQLDRDAIRKFVSDGSTQYSIASSSLSSTGLKVVFQNKPGVYSNMKEFFYTVIYFLKGRRIPGEKVCTNCGKPVDSPEIVSVQGCVHTCCHECAGRIADSNMASVRIKNNNNIVLGGLGALIGAAVGAALWIYTSYSGYFALWAGVVIPLLARLGYRLFGGRSAKAENIYGIVFSILGVLGAEFTSEALALAKRWNSLGYVFTLGDAFSSAWTNLLSSSKYWIPYIEAAGIGIAFALLTMAALIRVRAPGRSRTGRVEILDR
ncbi:MAG: hypothetical protein ACOX6J_03860 [Oscillospiraceae bacterium]|jgi:hypothetical protein